MRIVIIKDSEYLSNNAFHDPVSRLLQQQAIKNGYDYIQPADLAIADKRMLSDKAIVSIRTKNDRFFARKWWYEIRLPFFLKKINAAYVIHENGFCSRSVKIPQLVVAGTYGQIKKRMQYKRPLQQSGQKRLADVLAKATCVVTGSLLAKEFLMKNLKTPDEKIKVIYPCPDPEFRPVDADTKENLQEKYAGGSAYYIVTDFNDTGDLIAILKAFSKFKKWQQTGMKLIIVTTEKLFDPAFEEKIKQYKYRDDVKLIPAVPGVLLGDLLGAAYGLLHSVNTDERLLPVLNAMQCRVPVITSKLPETEEICGDGVLYSDDDHTLSKQMIRLYQEEKLHADLIEQSTRQLKKINDASLLAVERWWRSIGN